MFVSSRVTRLCAAAALSASLGGVSACSNGDSPTSPTPIANGPVVQSPSPSPTTPAPAPTPAPTVGALQITVNPNPVEHSGAPITDAAGCKDVKYTWFYDQVFRETGGSAVTLTNRIDLFDERETNNIGNLNIVVPAGGTSQIRSRWCSSNKAAHSAQTRWTGTDAGGRSISVLGPKVILNAPTP
jgi:hypothetical protein